MPMRVLRHNHSSPCAPSLTSGTSRIRTHQGKPLAVTLHRSLHPSHPDRRSHTDKTSLAVVRTSSNRHGGRLDGWHPTKQTTSSVWGPSSVQPLPLGAVHLTRLAHSHAPPCEEGIYADVDDATASLLRWAAVPVSAAAVDGVQLRPNGSGAAYGNAAALYRTAQ